MRKRCAYYARTILNVPLYWRGGVNQRDDTVVDSNLVKFNPVELRVKNGGHSVVANGKLWRSSQTTYEISNPGSALAGRDSILYYGNNYQKYRLWSWSAASDVPFALIRSTGTGLESIYISADDAVHLLIADPLGRRKGIDPSNGQQYDEIPDASYSDEFTLDSETGALITSPIRVLEILVPVSGIYTIRAIGVATGTYSLDARGFDQNDAQTIKIMSGNAAPDQVDVYSFTYNSAPGSVVDLQFVSSCPHVTGSAQVQVTQSAISWTPLTNATAYDVVRGNLDVLRSTGSFALATDLCIANDTTQLSVPYSANPAPGSAFWFVARGIDCSGPSTYDSGAPSQVGSRDAGIQASAFACP